MKISNILIEREICLRSKTELSFSRLLSFLGKDYQYDFKIKLMNGNEVLVDFKVDNKYIEILDSEKGPREIQ